MIVICNIGFLFAKIIVVQLLFQQVSGHVIKLRWFICLPVLYGLLFLAIPPVAYFTYFLFPVIYSLYLNRGQDIRLSLFYGLYPLIIESLFYRLFSYYIFPLFHIPLTNSIGSELVRELLIFPLYVVIINSLKINFQKLQSAFERNMFKHFLLFVNISMVIYLLCIQILLLFKSLIPGSSGLYRGHINNVYIILFFIMLLYLNAASKEKLEREIIEQKNNQLTALANYSQQIESLYANIRGFRHDYINVLTSLQLGIEREDIDVIKEVYNNVLKDSGDQFSHSKFDLAKLANISNGAVKSLLAAKFREAQSKGINVSIEIEDIISDFKIEILDFITIVSILFDNAIEACLASEYPQIDIAFIKLDSFLVLIVENSTKQEKIEIKNIFTKGYSSKGSGRGIGLHNIMTILDKYPSASIATKSASHQFCQTIEFR